MMIPIKKALTKCSTSQLEVLALFIGMLLQERDVKAAEKKEKKEAKEKKDY